MFLRYIALKVNVDVNKDPKRLNYLNTLAFNVCVNIQILMNKTFFFITDDRDEEISIIIQVIAR